MKKQTIFQLDKQVITQNTQWESALFDLQEYQYYRVSFQSKSDMKGVWGIFFYDAFGKRLTYDFSSSFDGSKQLMKNVSFFGTKHNASKGRIVLYPCDAKIDIRNITIEKVDWRDVLDWLKNTYRKLPRIKVHLIKKQKNTLNIIKGFKKEKIRIVLLGDSIMNDTANCFFDILLRKRYPSFKAEIIPSVRNSTGCTYYEKGNRVDKYIIHYNPDLLIIGGISNKGNVSAIRNVIRKVKRKINPEIIVLNEIFGESEKPHNNLNLSLSHYDGRNSYSYKLTDLAKKENFEFFDISTLWRMYLKSAKIPYEFFLRDKIHPNDYGRTILAYFLFYLFK